MMGGATLTSSLTVTELRRRVVPGAVFDVTNHYITREDSDFFGTSRRTVLKASNTGFYLSLPGQSGEVHPEGGKVDWPKAAQVELAGDGSLLIFGGPESADRWLVKNSRSEGKGKWHLLAGTHRPFDGAHNTEPLGDVGLCGKVDPSDRYFHLREGPMFHTYLCSACMKAAGLQRGSLFLTLTPVAS